MIESSEKQVQTKSLRDLVETVFRQKKKALCFFLAVTLSALAVLAFSPSMYTSTAKLIVHRGRDSVFVDPAAGGASLPLYKEWESEINTELEILNSRELVQQIIDTLGTEIFLAEAPPDPTGRLGPLRKLLNPVRLCLRKVVGMLSPGKTSPGASERQDKVDKVVRMIEKGLQISVRPKSDIIIVSYTAKSPQLAQQVVTELINNYLEMRIDLHQIPGGYQFFSQQTELLRNELEANEARILAVKKEGGVDSLTDDFAALQTSIEQIQTERMKVQASLASAKARVSTIRSMLVQTPGNGSGNQNNTILDPLEYKKLQETLRLEDASLAALVAQDQELGKQLARLRNDLDAIESLETPIRRLQREQDLLEAKYRKYSENREQARINQELETRKISNVTTVQHATLPEEANPSGKLIKLAAALFLGLFGALGLAFGADYIDPALYLEGDVKRRLLLGTLAELPVLRGKERDPAYSPPLSKERKSRWILHSGRNLFPDADSCFQDLYIRLLAMKPATATRPLVIGLTSSIGGEGVSTVAGRLAAAFACDERFPQVLLLDTNLTDHSSQMISNRTDLPYSVRKAGGTPDDQAGEMNASSVIEELNRVRQKDFDIILVDVPPLEEGNYAVRIATEVDLVALVVECGRTPWRSVKRASDLLCNAGATLSGIILNRQQYTMPKWIYRKL